jgi:hypothetical protein
MAYGIFPFGHQLLHKAKIGKNGRQISHLATLPFLLTDRLLFCPTLSKFLPADDALSSTEQFKVRSTIGTNPGNQGLDESKSFAIFEEIRANLIRGLPTIVGPSASFFFHTGKSK